MTYKVWYCHLCERKRRFYESPPGYYSDDGQWYWECSQGHRNDSDRYFKAERAHLEKFNQVFKEILLEPISDLLNNQNVLSKYLNDPETR